MKVSTTFSLEEDLKIKVVKASTKHKYRNGSHLVEEAIKEKLEKLKQITNAKV